MIAIHPAALEFPMMAKVRFGELLEDILANGLRVPITLCDGMVLDGRNRNRACAELGIKPEAVVFNGDPWAYVWSLNGTRRDLTDDVRALIWIHLQEKSQEWSRKRSEIAEEANAKRSEAQKDIPKAQMSERGGTSSSRTFAHPTRKAAAAASKTNPGAIARAEYLMKHAPALAEKVRRDEMPMIAAIRATKEAKRETKRAANRALIDAAPKLESAIEKGARFSTIVIDPPWDWGDEGDADQLGRARPTYGTMTIEQLLELPVAKLADKDSHLYLWITNRSLPKGFALLERWGFRFVTVLTWVKKTYGLGNYFRGSTEHLLFGVRGSLPLNRKDMGTWFAAPRGKEHSAKPTELYSIVESCSPGPYLEMFSRAPRKNWTAWGAES